MRFNRESFFDGYRGIVGSLSQQQVDGIEFLLGKIEEDTWENIPQIAYVLSTVEHETAHTFQPIKEYRAKVGTKARARQDKYWFTGYMGRGFVQLTHKENYEHYGIADEPNQALDPDKAYEILSDGMRTGVFTGHHLGQYVNRNRKDYFNARKVVNGLDKAQQIADRARAFESILMESAQLHEQEAEEPETHHAARKPPPTVVEAEAKGVTTSPDKTPEETAGSPPPAPAAEVKGSQVSLFTKLTSLSLPAGALTVLGAVWKFVSGQPPYFWAAFCLMLTVFSVIGYLIWRDAKRQAHERTLKLMDAAAAPEKNNLRLV